LTARDLGKPRAGRRALSLTAKAAGTLVFGTVVGLGLLYLRLLYGPVVLDFLAAPIERAIAEELDGPRVRIGSVALGLNDRGLFQIELKDVRVNDAGGDVLVAAPTVAVSLSRRAMLRGRIAVESLDLMSAQLVLFYAEDGTLALKFSPAPAETEGPKGPPVRVVVPSSTPPPPGEGDGMLGRIDLVKVLSEASARARRGETAGAFLREIGLRSATVVIDNGRRKTTWHVPQLDVDLDHRRTRSSLAGRAKIESAAGAWELTFRSREHIRDKALNLSINVQGLVPKGLAEAFPNLAALEAFDVPLTGEAKLELSSVGEILGGKILIEIGAGSLALPTPTPTAMRIDGGRIELTYDGAARKFELGASSLAWGDGHVELAGTFVHTAEGAEGPRWAFEVAATKGALGADPERALPIDQFTATGHLAPEHGRIVLDRLLVQAGGTDLVAQGEMADVSGVMKTRLEGRIGAMPVSMLTTLWPAWLAPETRVWVSSRLKGGTVQGGTFKVLRGIEQPNRGWAPVSDDDRMAFTLEGADLELALDERLPPLEVVRALLRIEGPTVELSAPEAAIALADGRKLALKAGFSVDLSQPVQRRKGVLTLKGQAPLSLAIELLDRAAPHVLKDGGLPLAGSEGKIDGSFVIDLPLAPQMQLQDAKIEGKLRVSDARIRKGFGAHDIQGINVDVDVSSSAIDAKGKFLIRNVPATVSGQHVFGAPPDKQPPLRIAATLYDNERTELGLDINELVQGEVATEITVVQNAKGEPQVHLRADLTNARLTLESLAWSKPVGKRAAFEFDIVKGSGAYPVEMHNVRLDGENVAIAGWMGAGADFKVREYKFPQFSLNVVSNFQANGKLRASDNVWEIHAKGVTFDGRDLFRSFYSAKPEKYEKHRQGFDVRVEFDAVLGSRETSLRNVKLSMQKRHGRMVQLETRGILVEGRGRQQVGGRLLEAHVRPEPGRPRTLIAKSSDAGMVFKLMGFLPNAVGGDLQLEVNLDGKGAAERTGLLVATHFHMLGNELGPDPFKAAEPRPRKRTAARERIPFNVLRVPFAIGQGQFWLGDGRLEGPVFSATGKGTIDFKTKRMNISGVFTPVAELNQILRDIPLLGDLITGPKGEGMFALNFALHGALENPQVTFNPLSGVAPGATRELFPIFPEEPRTPSRRDGSSRIDTGERSSSSLATGPSGDDGVSGGVGEGWLSEKAWSARKQ
jgi:hypothetical protein